MVSQEAAVEALLTVETLQRLRVALQLKHQIMVEQATVFVEETLQAVVAHTWVLAAEVLVEREQTELLTV
jgi:hypothetical protein